MEQDQYDEDVKNNTIIQNNKTECIMNEINNNESSKLLNMLTSMMQNHGDNGVLYNLLYVIWFGYDNDDTGFSNHMATHTLSCKDCTRAYRTYVKTADGLYEH